MKNKWWIPASLAVIALAFGAGVTWSQGRDLESGRMSFAHHGYLTDGERPYHGQLEFRFEMFFDGVKGFEENEKLDVDNGYYSTIIGDSADARDLPEMMRRSTRAELVVTVIEEGQEFTLEPPQLIHSAPLAFGVVGEAIGEENLKPNSVRERALGAGAVTADKVAAGAVGEGALQDEAVTRNKLGRGAVNASKIADNSLRPNHFIPGSLSGDLLAPGAVGSQQIGDGSITGADIQQGAISHYHMQSTAGLVLQPRLYSRTASGGVFSQTAGALSAQCDPGDTILSGGCVGPTEVLHQGTEMVLTTNDSPGRYVCTVFNASVVEQSFQAQAVCLRNQ